LRKGCIFEFFVVDSKLAGGAYASPFFTKVFIEEDELWPEQKVSGGI
jgi:hypothetical protein